MKKIYLKERLHVIFNPIFWFSSYPSCKRLSKSILLDIKNNLPVEFEKESYIEGFKGYTVMFGNRTIWVENYPYSFGYLYYDKCDINSHKSIPYRYVRLILKRYIDEAWKKNIKKNEDQ